MSSSEPPVLLVGWSRERTLRRLAEHLREAGREFTLLDLGEVVHASVISIVATPGGMSIVYDGRTTHLEAFDSIFCRVFASPQPTARQRAVHDAVISEVLRYLQYTRATVVNRPRSGAANASKLVQLRDLRACGFRVPETFLSGSPSHVKQRVGASAEWVSKGASGTRTRVAAIDKAVFLTIDSVRKVPSLFQSRVEGDDVRLHVIGEEMIGLRIATCAVDYRYATRMGFEMAVEAIEPPLSIRVACIEYCRREGLIFAGFDFKIDRQTGEWIVLECNPMPGFDFFDDYAEGAIARALERALFSVYRQQQKVLVEREPLIPTTRRPAVDRG